MNKVTTIGLDLAKRVFQVHGVDAAGAVMLRRQLKRRQVGPFFTKLPSCLIGLEACGTAHHWGCTLQALGHTVRLIPPAYAKAYVRRNKADPADAAAICEAVSRPSMRFVPIKSETDQAMAAVHRVRERLIAQPTQIINMLRGQMAEFGIVASKGPQHVKELLTKLVEPGSVPEPLRQVLLGLVWLLTALAEQIAALDKQILAWHRANPCSQRLSAIPGFGPILSSALALRVQEPQRFACGRDLSAWIGPCSCQGQTLAPKQNSSGGKVRLGAISEKGDIYLRRLLINSLPSGLTRWGAPAVLNSKRAKTDPWIAQLLQAKPRLVVAVAVANKMARIAWALMVRRTAYHPDFRRAPVAA
jgi:transposase